MGTDWTAALLRGATPVPVEGRRRDPLGWPGYTPRPAVALHRLASGPVAAVWDFAVLGGSFGEDDAAALAHGVDLAVAARVPLLTVLRSGGTRLQEGMAALVGIPRARLALLRLAAARLGHLCVIDQPTAGGVWVALGATADVRLAVAGATVGFAGPRVAEALTGQRPEGSHGAEAALRAGLVDAVLAPGPDVAAAVTRALGVLLAAGSSGGPATASSPTSPSPRPAAQRGGWEQVLASRAGDRPSGRDLLARLLAEHTPLLAPRGDGTVAAGLGLLGEGRRPVVAAALAAERGGRPTPDGYRLLARAARLADRLALPLLTLIDTPGAEPGSVAENDGLAAAIADALDAVVTCRSPVLAVLHGEGGSGGALAAAVGDRVLVTPDSYFAVLGPEGAGAALRRPASECADLMGVTPADLLALGFADGWCDWSALPAELERAAAATGRRAARWAGPLGGWASGRNPAPEVT